MIGKSKASFTRLTRNVPGPHSRSGSAFERAGNEVFVELMKACREVDLPAYMQPTGCWIELDETLYLEYFWRSFAQAHKFISENHLCIEECFRKIKIDRFGTFEKLI